MVRIGQTKNNVVDLLYLYHIHQKKKKKKNKSEIMQIEQLK